MNVTATITREAIAAGLGLGAAATAALFSSGGQAEQVIQLPTEDVSQSMQMDSLAKEIQSLEGESIWVQEYAQTETKQTAKVWADEFVTLAPDMDQAWTESTSMPPRQQLLNSSQWADEFMSTTTDNALQTNVTAIDFMSTVEQRLSNLESQMATDWANEYEFEFNPQTTSNWVDEYTAGQDQQQEFFQKLQAEWDQQLADEQTHSWLSPGTNSAFNQDYKFGDNNSYTTSENPLADGRQLLEHGDIPNAVLAFEAAVQRNPEDLEAWVALGKTQAANEQDPKAISALNQALKIQPQNLAALLALGASLTNEAFQLQAAQALKNWLMGNPKYSSLIPSGSQPDRSKVSSVVSKDELKSIQESFIEAARLNPRQDLDPDVQSGLGILFNLGNEYEKAADCFRAALSLRPNDSLLWNRLGATLANGGKSAEAISAYRRALELTPGFIRTRFNLGISCSNLGAHREAAEHFLTALNQQATGKQSSLMSDSIWSSLRMILHMMGRGDLVSSVDTRNLQKLSQEFNLS